MNEIIFLVEDAGGFTARALGHSIFTAGDTEQELHAMIKDAVACHFDEAEAPKITRLHYVREQGSLGGAVWMIRAGVPQNHARRQQNPIFDALFAAVAVVN